jgi:hypothetical protein
LKKHLRFGLIACALVTATLVGSWPASASGEVITLKGTDKQTTPGTLSAGAYIVRLTAGSFLSFTVKSKANEVLYVDIFNEGAPSNLLIVGGQLFKPGDVVFELDGMDAWTVTLTKVEAAGAVALPQVLAGAERAVVISKPFKAAAGNLVMSYTYKTPPRGTGTLTICNVATGKTVPMSQMMSATKASGGWTMTVSEAGVYVASTIFPLASGGGEVKLSQ